MSANLDHSQNRDEQPISYHCRYCGTRRNCVYRQRLGICFNCLNTDIWEKQLKSEGYLTEMEANQ